MKKDGFSLKVFLLPALFCLYGILKMSSAIIELTKNTESTQKEQNIKLGSTEHFGRPVTSYMKSSAKTK